MYRNSYQHGMLTVFFSCGSNPLNIWETHTKDGYIERFLDQDIKSMVLEIGGTNVSTTFIQCPKGKTVLGIAMPFLVMIVKNLKKYFSFEVTILDETGTRRRFRASNFQSNTQILPLCTVMPIGLSEGWNQIQFNLAEFTRRAYNKQFVEVQKIKINANIRLRRVYFTERLVPEEELPPEYKLFFPLSNKIVKKGNSLKPEPVPPEPITEKQTASLTEKKNSTGTVKNAKSSSHIMIGKNMSTKLSKISATKSTGTEKLAQNDIDEGSIENEIKTDQANAETMEVNEDNGVAQNLEVKDSNAQTKNVNVEEFQDGETTKIEQAPNIEETISIGEEATNYNENEVNIEDNEGTRRHSKISNQSQGGQEVSQVQSPSTVKPPQITQTSSNITVPPKQSTTGSTAVMQPPQITQTSSNVIVPPKQSTTGSTAMMQPPQSSYRDSNAVIEQQHEAQAGSASTLGATQSLPADSD